MMTPERWRLVKALVSAALERSDSDRERYLNEACGDDADLRREIDSLLSATSAVDDIELNETDAFARAISAAASAAVFSSSDRAAPRLMAELQGVLGDEFRLDRELGGGGMSHVFIGVEIALNRAVVVKVLRSEQAQGAAAERFAREVRFAARLQQANIVPVLRVGGVGELAYYIMPYRGESLRQWIASGVRPTTAEALDVMKDIAKALACAHGEGVVHRDIKPENILLSGGTAVVADFGIAKTISAVREPSAVLPNSSIRADGMSTTEGVAIGTPAYMAPEQAAGETALGPAVDVYAFGLVSYELLAGAHPFEGTRGAAALMRAQIVETPRPLIEHRPDLAPGLTSLVMRCLAKDPALRPPHGAALLSALSTIESESSGIDLPSKEKQAAAMPSVAVLPLESTNPDDEFFADGITDEVLTALTRMNGLRVAARTSSFSFKGQSIDTRKIAQELGVTTLLQGTIRRDGTHVRIAIWLVNAADGLHLWSEQYNREVADIFAVQEEIAGAIAIALEHKLIRERKAAPIVAASRSRQLIINPDAFELYLRGRALLEQRSDGMHQGLECLESASRLAPEFSGAHSAISLAYTLFGIYHALRPHEAFPRAHAAAQRALDIDPNDVLAIVMRAHTALWYDWQLPVAEQLVQRALALAPGFHLAHECLGFVFAAQGRFDDAIAAMERGRSLDPISENATYDLAWILLLAGRWEQAIRELEPALAKFPRMSELRRVYGFALFYSGRVAEGCSEFRRVLELKVGDRWGSLNFVQALAALGEVTEARRLTRELEDRATREPIPAFGIAIMHHWLGDDESALHWLEKAIEARYYWLVMAAYDPSLIRLRDNPRFVQLMRQVRGSISTA
jgi:eukaryotic-like serine/threonine-protein kinase